MEAKTFFAVAELVQAAAHQQGIIGPVEFTICGEKDYDWCDVQDNYAEVTEEEFIALLITNGSLITARISNN